MRKYLLILFIVLSLPLFAQQWHIKIEVLQPAKFALPEKVGTVLIVNNTYPQPADFGHRESRYGVDMGNVEVDITDAPQFLLFAAAAELDNADVLESVQLENRSQNKSSSFYMRRMLSREQVRELCQTYSVDALLVCNQLVFYDLHTLWYDNDEGYGAALEMYNSSHWTLHTPDGKTTAYSYADTLVWESTALSTADAAVNALPDRVKATMDMASYTGERFAACFVPQWVQADRYLYENKDEQLQSGLDLFRHKRFDEAIEVWETQYAQLSDSKRKKNRLTAAYLAADMAVAYEMTDQLPKALQWANQSQRLFSSVGTSAAMQQQINMLYYCQQLRKRQ